MSKPKESKVIEVTKIIIKVGDKELSLTIDEVKQLKKELEKICATPQPQHYPITINPIPLRPDPFPWGPTIFGNGTLVKALEQGDWNL